MEKKLKVLMLSDHPLSTSGVGTQSRWLIQGLLATGRYSFRCFGGAVKHEDYSTVTVNPDFIVKPTNGFGDRTMLRTALAQERPDVLLLFTDPRFFIWVWEMEDEVRSVCPIAYNHLWDNGPWPEFNRVLYESTDLINCINWPTYQMLKERFPDRTHYIPHAVPGDVFRPLDSSEALRIRNQVLGPARVDHFVVTFVSRNARRKMPSDVMASFRLFLDSLRERHGHARATLVMHTDPADPEGPNLHHVIELFALQDHVVFSKERIGFAEMNYLYGISDAVVNISCNEGFGLSALEAKMAGKPIIALKTGGLTRQVVDADTGEEYGVGLEPEVRALVGNQLVPYIYEDFVSHATVADAMLKLYEWGPERRSEVGRRAAEHALREYSMERMIGEWDRTLTALCAGWRNARRWERIEL